MRGSTKAAYSFDEVQDILTKAILMRKKASRDPGSSTTKDMRRREAQRNEFIRLLEMIFSNIDCFARLRKSGCDDRKFFQAPIQLGGIDMADLMETVTREFNRLSRLDKRWTKRLRDVDKNSSCFFELNSLFGQNYLRIEADNCQHYLRYLFGAREVDVSEHAHLDWSSSLKKIESLTGLKKIFDQKLSGRESKLTQMSPPVEFFRYKSSDNLFELVLRRLAQDDAKPGSLFSANFVIPNQILLSTRSLAFEELDSKPRSESNDRFSQARVQPARPAAEDLRAGQPGTAAGEPLQQLRLGDSGPSQGKEAHAEAGPLHGRGRGLQQPKRLFQGVRGRDRNRERAPRVPQRAQDLEQG